MPRETLYHCLHKGGIPLSWVRRLKICLEAARGLEYLHRETDTKSKVLHLDFKSSNILLTSDWAAKVSDFGTSIVRPIDSTYVTHNVPGTWGYRAPEFLLTGKATRKTDVFAFGVVMFEVLCVKEAVYRSISVEWKSLAASAQNSIEKKKLEEIIDPDIRGRISPKCLKEFVVLANKCLHSEPEQRPNMAEVVKDLESILALHNTDEDKFLTKLFGARASNQKNSAGSISLKSLDKYLYTVVGEDRIVVRFSFDAILKATENFSEANNLSSGRYKFMYKGKLQNGHDITVDHYSDVNIDECEELKNDASILVKLEHKNVIQLLGYCIDRGNVYLVYDSAFNATLAGLIFDPMCNVLDWNKRHKIILGVARGLIYLHSYAPNQIIHFDLNPENILLDESFEPKLSGFRFATAANETDRIHFNRIRGNMGHKAPELMFRSLSTKADVFSFGVFVLNIVTGKKSFDGTPVAQNMLVDYVQRNWLEGTSSNIVDPRIDVADSILMTNFMEIGLLCAQEMDVVRPTMEQVSAMLLGSLPLTLHISEPRARMMNGKSLYFRYNLDLDMDFPPLCDRFTVSEIRRATRGFDKSLVIGQGLCSKVYKGSFIKGERIFNVAVKRLKVSFSQAELWAEVEILSKFKHPHLVSLFGYCGDKREIFLVYEFMPNGTLADHFQKGRAPLTWARRLKICLEVARCLDYLHSERIAKPSIIHDNVNSSTILLASNWAAKLSGFRFPNINLTHRLSIYEVSLLPPKFKYADTHYFQNWRVTTESDVHSFGVVMLEVLCGKKTVYTSIDGERTRLRTWAEDSTKEGRLEKIMDPNLVGKVSSDCLKKFARLANRCLLDNPEQRPTMVEVVKDLESILDLEEKRGTTLLQ